MRFLTPIIGGYYMYYMYYVVAEGGWVACENRLSASNESVFFSGQAGPRLQIYPIHGCGLDLW